MEYSVFDDIIVVRLDKDEKITESLLRVAKEEGISLASVSGIGATDDFEVGVFDLEKKEYDRIHYTGNHEITSLTGNVTTKDGAPYLHLHITCAGAGGKMVGGHLFDAKISLTAEIFLQKANGKTERLRDDALGINKMLFR